MITAPFNVAPPITTNQMNEMKPYESILKLLIHFLNLSTGSKIDLLRMPISLFFKETHMHGQQFAMLMHQSMWIPREHQNILTGFSQHKQGLWHIFVGVFSGVILTL